MTSHRYVAITTVLVFGLLVWFMFRSNADAIPSAGRAIADDARSVENSGLTSATATSATAPTASSSGGYSTHEIIAWAALFALATAGFVILSRLQRRRFDAFKAAEQRDKAQSRSDSQSDIDIDN